EEDGFHAGVGGDDGQRVYHLLRVAAPADVEEVRGLPAVVLDQVHRSHGQAGAVDAAADVAFQLDEREPRLTRPHLGGRLGGGVPQRGDVRPALQLVVVHHDLGVERQHLAVGGGNERVDLGQRG